MCKCNSFCVDSSVLRQPRASRPMWADEAGLCNRKAPENDTLNNYSQPLIGLEWSRDLDPSLSLAQNDTLNNYSRSRFILLILKHLNITKLRYLDLKRYLGFLCFSNKKLIQKTMMIYDIFCAYLFMVYFVFQMMRRVRRRRGRTRARRENKIVVKYFQTQCLLSFFQMNSNSEKRQHTQPLKDKFHP